YRGHEHRVRFLQHRHAGGPAIFTINGTVLVGNDWHNGGQMNGSGRFCINHNTWNSGALTGTFDFCDLTGGDVDLNTGTVAGSITYCTTPCDVGTGEGAEEVLVDIFPDPFSSSANVRTGRYLHNAAITVVDGLGRTVLRMSNITGRTATLHRDGLPSGPYLLRLTQEGQVLATERIIIHD
ncbi:MAG TPA: T9SS type A sorting domain-containing protein, partial [Flavobacteriales bacterium]|nr:T9SS type A sorting domain-containing protein [Flavobacteriales bacterium]